MKMRNSLFLPGLLVLTFAQGCGGNADKADIVRIDSVYALVEKTGMKLNEINIDSVNAKNELYKANATVLSENIYDIKNDETWPWICAYSNVRKPFKTMVTEYKKYKAELDTCKKQLDDMKHDLGNGALSKTDFNTYFIVECCAVNDLNRKISSGVNSVKGQLKNFDTVYPVICRIIKEFKENEAKSPKKDRKEEIAPEETD